MSKIVEYIQKQKALDKYDIGRVTCADGFTVYCHAGWFYYCTPRVAFAEWDTIELATPSEVLPDHFTMYAENEENLLETFYSYVPVSLVDALLELHGGIANGQEG